MPYSLVGGLPVLTHFSSHWQPVCLSQVLEYRVVTHLVVYASKIFVPSSKKKKKKVSSSFTPHTYSNRAGTEEVSGEVGWGAISTESTCLLNSSKFHLNLEIYLQDQILFPSESAKISSVISVLGMQNIANCFCTLLRFAEVPFQVLQKRDVRKNCCTHQQLFLPPRLHPPRCHHWHQMCLYRIVQANEYRTAS